MKKFILLFVLFFLLLNDVRSEFNSTTDLPREITNSELIVHELSSNGFNIQRVNDTLKAAKQIYEAQSQIRNENRQDYSLVIKYLEEIKILNEQAYIARDEIIYVYSAYNETIEKNSNINLSEADKIITEMQFEFDNERYEESYDLAKEAYSKITELEGKYTALGLAYKATTQTLKNFIISNWIILLILLFSVTFLYIILKNRIQYLRTNDKIKRLGREAKVIEELLRETQKEYFEKGKMSESTYKIRIDKFSQLMRDIERQVPLLKEDLARLNRKTIEDKEEKKKIPKKKIKKKKHKKK